MKILAFTSIRSDYDLLSPLYKLLHKDKEINFKLLVSGAHLSEKFGNTINYIREDGFYFYSIESLIDSSSNRARVKSAAILFQSAIDYVYNFNPDLIILAGDREDMMIGALIGFYLNIPIIHFFGGDHEKDGHPDTYIRHAISKLATVHFVSTEEHKERLIALGENKKRIFNIGSVSLDKFVEHIPLSYNELLKTFPKEKELNNYALVIYHPVNEEKEKAGEYFEQILKALEETGYSGIVSYPNTDPGYHYIIKVIEKYKSHKKFFFYKNLPRDYFLSIFKNAKFIIGNSSAGIYEAASIPIPAINVGLRQKNRFCKENVIFVDNNLNEIKNAILKVSDKNFRKKIKNIKNPYGNGNSAIKAYNLIKSIDFKSFLPKIEDPLEVVNEYFSNSSSSR
jgi:UDP-hydrolysing UDP-N-acetyl-D-glucosamine 2-epimerase